MLGVVQGLRHPWEGHDDHGHGHGSGPVQYEYSEVDATPVLQEHEDEEHH